MKPKPNLIKIISAIAAVITFSIGIWQFIEWRSERYQDRYDGQWTMQTEIETASYRPYVGMKAESILHVTQSDHNLSGTGEKVKVNGTALNFRDRTSMTFQGSIEDETFTINYFERGKLRESSGMLSGEFTGNELHGTLSSTASDSRGRIKGYKMR